MYCINCGRKLEDEANFCPACGTKRAELKADTLLDTAETLSPAPAKSKKPRGTKMGKKLLIAGVVAIILLLLCLIIFVGGNAQKNSGYEKDSAAIVTQESAAVKTPIPTAKPSPAPKPTAKPTASPIPKTDGDSGLVTKDELMDKYSSSTSSDSSKSSGGALQALIEKYSTPAPTATPKSSSSTTSGGILHKMVDEAFNSSKPSPTPNPDRVTLQDLIEKYGLDEPEQVSGATESSTQSYSNSCYSCGGSGDCWSCGGKGGKNKWTGDSYVWQDCAFCSGGSCPYC